MIPEFGLMIGAYVVTRMLALMVPPENTSSRILIGVFAGGTIAVALFVSFDLMARGASLNPLVRP